MKIQFTEEGRLLYIFVGAVKCLLRAFLSIWQRSQALILQDTLNSICSTKHQGSASGIPVCSAAAQYRK